MSSLKARVRGAARRTKQLIAFWRIDRSKGVPVNLGLLRRGFLSQRKEFYPLDRYDLDWFLSDWAIENFFSTLNSPFVKAQLNDKLYFHLLLRELGLDGKLAPLIGVVVDGIFTTFSEQASLEKALLKYSRLIVKPVDGLGGRGVYAMQQISGSPTKGTFVIEAALQQHDYAARIFPGSVNTMRIMTLRSGSAEPFIIGAAHRFGVQSSAPVDNFSRGGIVAYIDSVTGRLSAARSAPGRFAQSRHPHHPETKAPIEGVMIPSWDAIKHFVLEVARGVPGLKLAGWDVTLTANGPRLIEANGSVPNPELIQTERPLLLDPQTRGFFADHGVISRKLADRLTHLQALDKTAKRACGRTD